MLIYDRRRCRPLPDTELRQRLTLAQRAKLVWLESTGWRLLFLRGTPASAFLSHADKGYATIIRDGRVVSVRSLALRPDDSSRARPAETTLIDVAAA